MGDQPANEKDQEQKDQAVNIDDLPVDGSEQDDVKGGMLLPAVQKVRESA
jgi:hypothetical protein